MKSSVIQAAALCLMIAAAPSARGQSADPSFSADLTRIDSAAAGVKDLSARFEQEKFTSMLKKPLESRGTVRTSGRIARWDTQEPQPCVLYADQSEFKLYYPAQKLEEVYSLDQRIGEMMSSPVPRLKTIEDHFTIARATPGDLSDEIKQAQAANQTAGRSTLALRLLPSDKNLAEHVANVTVLLDIASGLSVAVETTDPDGDRTVIFFSDIHANAGITPAELELKVPSDTTISHPLDASIPDSAAKPNP